MTNNQDPRTKNPQRMAIDFTRPELGETITSGDVVNVLVKEGDVIEANQGVVELETDKAVIEVPAPHAGKVTKVHVQKKQTVEVGQPLISIETDEKAEKKPDNKAEPPKADEKKPEKKVEEKSKEKAEAEPAKAEKEQ